MARLDSRRYGSPPSSAKLHDSIFLPTAILNEKILCPKPTHQWCPTLNFLLFDKLHSLYLAAIASKGKNRREKIVGVKIKLFYSTRKKLRSILKFWWEKLICTYFHLFHLWKKILQIHFSLQNFSVVNNFTYHFLSRIACSV